MLALGLYLNGLHNIRIYVINTDRKTDLQQLKQTIHWINSLVHQNDYITLLDCGQPSIVNDFGYEMTDRALEYFYYQYTNSSSICQYITITNADNFYLKKFAKRLLPRMKEKRDIIAWGFISHHYKPQDIEKSSKNKVAIPQIIDEGTEKCISVKLVTGFADLGTVAYRLAFLQMHKLYFRAPDKSYGFGSDGYFVTIAATKTNSSVILRQTLFVHQ